MKFLLTILFFGFVFLSNAQNLVLNPSFEDTVACPTGASQLEKSKGWTMNINTPDYFNKCSHSNLSSIPKKLLGFQHLANGEYAGFSGTGGGLNTFAGNRNNVS